MIAGSVESRVFAAVLDSLILVDVADCTNPETGFDPTEPLVVIEGVDLIESVGTLD